MASIAPRERVEADDQTLRRVLDDAFLPALLPALAHATGDLGLLQSDLRPTTISPGAPNGGMTPEQQERAKSLAFDALRKFVDGGAVPAPSSEATVRTITNWIAGADATDEQVRFFYEELQPDGTDPRAPGWRKDPKIAFSVAIVGAGMSGILSGVRLKQAGVPFMIIEKNADVGGTWFENTYPGARVDVANAFYSYSFAQDVDWPNHFSPQQVLLDYFRDCADELRRPRAHPLRDGGRRGGLVDDERARWTRAAPRRRTVREETIEAQAVISAVGQLNRPKMPDIAGHGDVRGAVVPLGALGPRRRPQGQARRRDRHRRERGAVRPGDRDRGRRADVYPAHADVVLPGPELPRGGARTGCAGCSVTSRTTRTGTASGSSGR